MDAREHVVEMETESEDKDVPGVVELTDVNDFQSVADGGSRGLTNHERTHFRREGAEFLTVGELLVRGVEAHKSYTGQRAFDVVPIGRPDP